MSARDKNLKDALMFLYILFLYILDIRLYTAQSIPLHGPGSVKSQIPLRSAFRKKLHALPKGGISARKEKVGIC